MASDSDDDYSLLNLDDGKDSSVGQTVSPASPESAGGSPSQRAPAQTLQSNLSLILGHGEQDPQAGVQALSPQHSHISQKPPAMENPSSSSDSATDTKVSNLTLILSGEGPAEAESDVMQDSPQPQLHSGSEPPAVENPPRSSDSATDAKVSNKTVNISGEGPAEAEMNVRQDSPQLQLHPPSDSDEDEGGDGGTGFDDEAHDEGNLTDSDLTDDETHPVAVATASGGGVVLTFTAQPGTTEDDETSRPSPVHKENTEESSVRGSVKDIIKAFESTGSREPRPPPAVPFPAPPSPPQQGDGDGSDTEEDHTPISEPCDKAYDDDRDKAYDDEESVQDFSLLADSDPHAAENVALGTPEAEEEKGEVESKGPTDQDGMMKMSTPLSSDSEDDVSEECGKTEEKEAVAQGFLTPEASSPAGGQANVSKDAEEEDAADDEDDHFVMAPEEHEDLHADINVFPSTHVSPSAQKDGSPTTAQSFTEPPQVVFTDTQHEKQQHIDSPVQDTPEPVRQFHSPGFRGQGSGTPPQWQKSEGEQLSGHMTGSQRLHSPQPMYEPRHSPDVQGPVSLGDGAFRPVPQRPQQMWASQHEGLGHGHPPQHQSAAWQWQQQQFPTPPQWAHGYNPNTAAPPQQYGPGTPAYANTPRGQFSHDQQYRQQQPYRQQQQQTYQQYMQQQARQRGPAVTPTTPLGPRMQGRGRGMQHGLTSAGHGQPFHAPPGGFQTPDVSLGASTPTKSPKVCVRGVDASTDLELLQLYFESPRKSGGDSISDVSDHRQQGYIVLTFEDPAVVNHVLERPHTVAHKTLSVSLHQEEPQAEETPDASRKVEVRGGSIVTEADMMELYFESKKSGGGPIERVEVDENAGVAVITFEDASTAAEVLKRSHKFSGTSLTVTPYQPPSPSATIKVSGLKRSVSEDLIQLYFENGRIGGGDVTEVKLNSEEGEALVTFVDPAVIPNILKRNHTIAKSAVTVTLATTTPTKISSEKSTKASVPTPASDPSTVEVTGLSANTTEETLQYYFENKRRSGGGMVKNLDFVPDTGVAKITFEDAEAAKRVLEKQHKLDGKQITVSIYRSAAPVKTSPKSSGTDSSGLNTVAVRGFKRSVSEDMLFNYFENKRRSGGGPVAEVKTDFKKGVVFITFENAEDAASVASRKQKIEGQNLEASIYRPPKMMKDHILFTGLPEIKSSDELQNFIEAKTDEEVRSILFGDEEGTAVVIFEREINFQNVQAALSKHRFLKKHTLRVEQVPVTSTILVREWAWDSPPTEDMLTNYFENARRSSGGEVTDLELTEDQEFALVTFADTEVAARVASRKHKINGCAVDVCLFMECLGRNGGSEEPSPKLPEPLIVSDSDQQKISLLQEIPHAFEALEGALEECSAYLTQDPGKVQIACSLTTDVTGLRQLIKGWAVEATRVVQNFLQAVHVEEVEVTGEEYEEADGSLRALADENEVGMRYIGQDGKMFIIWDRPEKQQVAEKMKKILNDVKRNLSRKKMQRKETVKGVPKGKLSLIQKHNIWHEIREKFPEMTVTPNTEGGFVELTGLEDEIQEAKLLLLEVLNEIVSVRQDWDSDLAVQLLKSPDAQSIIFAICLNADPEGGLEFASDYVEIHSFDGRRAEAMQVAARNAVQRRVIKFTNENAEARTLSAWAELKESLCQKNNGLMLLQEEEERLTIVSVSSTIKDDHQALKDFITQNTVQECAFDLDQPFHALLKSYLRDRQLGLPITLDDVFFDEDVGKIRVRGTRACIDAAETMYNMFCRSIVHIRKTYTQPSMKMFLQSPDWKYKCLDIEQRLQCKILEPTPELENFLVNDDSGGYGDVGQAQGRLSPEYADFLPSADDDEFVSAVPYPSGGQLSRRRGQTRSRPQAESAPARRSGVKPDIPAKPRIFLSAMSDITKEEHDVLVNSTNPGLNLENGLVSRALLDVGGPTLQQECKTKYPQGIQMGEIAVTGPGQQDGQQKLMCKRLFHCTLPETKDVEQIKKVVKEAVTKCLTTAEELREKEQVEIKSIGVPALGTGTLKYPPQLVAETMFEAVLEYGRQHPATRISDMNFIVYKKDETNMQVFRAEHDKYNQLKQEAQAWEKEEETSPPLVDPPAQAGVKAYKFFQDTKGKVSLMFLGLSEKTVTEAARELMECYTQKVHEVSHDVAQLEQWDDLSVKNLVSACKAVCVDVTFNFSMGRLTLCGFRENVDRIPVHDILKEAESQLRMKHNAQVMAQQIQWIYLEVDEYGEHPLSYDLYSNYKIEMAYRNNEPKVVCLDSDNVAFVIDFTTMEETPENPGDEDFVPMTVMRRDKIKESALDAPLPDHWSDMRGEDLDAVTLKAGDTEYNRVATWFMNSLKQPTAQITMIQRVQNATLYKQYMAMKKMLESPANLPAGRSLERQRMWHGTKGETKDGIIRYGFNRSYSDKNRSAYGQGAYFATEAEYSSRDAYAVANLSGERHMFLCKVLVGEYVKGDQNMRLPPEIPNSSGRLYNTTVDDDTNPTIFVTYSDVQAYPEYLIVFKDN